MQCVMSSRDEIIQSDFCILLPPPLNYHTTLSKLDVATLPKNVNVVFNSLSHLQLLDCAGEDDEPLSTAAPITTNKPIITTLAISIFKTRIILVVKYSVLYGIFEHDSTYALTSGS